MRFPLNKTSRNDFKESFGRTIIIDTTKCGNIDNIKSKTKNLMPKLYPYLEQEEREIKYPYSCLPIFVSKVKLGSHFININAAGLKSSEWQDIIKLIHKLYEYPFYSIYNKLSAYKPVEKLFIEGFSEITDKMESNFTEGKKHFNNTPKPQDITLPKNYYNMMNLLRACCLTISDFLDKQDDGQELPQLGKLIERAFLSETLSNCNVNNKIQSDFDISNSLEQIPETTQEESNFIKVLRDICDSCVDNRPQAKSEADSIAFLYNKNEFNAICFREEFFKTLVQKLSIDNYDWEKFRDNCICNDLIESNNNAKDISIRVDGTPMKFFELNKDKISCYLAEQ